MATAHTPRRPWYREPMMWLVLGLPAAVVAASLSTLTLAIRAGGIDAVSDEVQRTGRIQVAALDADAEARRLGLSARLAVDADTGALSVELQGGDPAEPLRLDLRHPTVAAEDRQVALTPAGARWLGRTDAPMDHDWKLELAPEDRRWRLVARLPKGRDEARLLPALDEG